jgi:hypothetical protein
MKVYLIIMLAALLSFSGCAPKASSSLNSSAGNLSNYRTFAWLPADVQTNNPKYKGDIIDSKIKSSVRSELESRGLMEVPDNQNPDLLLGYHVYTENKQQMTGGYYGGYPGWGGYYGLGGWGSYYGPGWGWGYGFSSPSIYNYTEGTLILDVMDNRTKQVVWRGSIDGDVTNTKKLDKKIEKGVEAIMEDFPIKGSGSNVKIPS